MGLNMPSWVATCCIRRRPRSFSVSANFTTRLDEAPWAGPPTRSEGRGGGSSPPLSPRTWLGSTTRGLASDRAAVILPNGGDFHPALSLRRDVRETRKG